MSNQHALHLTAGIGQENNGRQGREHGLCEMTAFALELSRGKVSLEILTRSVVAKGRAGDLHLLAHKICHFSSSAYRQVGNTDMRSRRAFQTCVCTAMKIQCRFYGNAEM